MEIKSTRMLVVTVEGCSSGFGLNPDPTPSLGFDKQVSTQMK